MSISDLKLLCERNTIVQQVVARYANEKVAEISDAKKELDREHGEVLNAFKAIADTGCATLKIGRRGRQTRIIWMQEIKDITLSKSEKIDLPSDGTNCEDQYSEASLNQLIDAIKSYHNVTSVHLVY